MDEKSLFTKFWQGIEDDAQRALENSGGLRLPSGSEVTHRAARSPGRSSAKRR